MREERRKFCWLQASVLGRAPNSEGRIGRDGKTAREAKRADSWTVSGFVEGNDVAKSGLCLYAAYAFLVDSGLLVC